MCNFDFMWIKGYNNGVFDSIYFFPLVLETVNELEYITFYKKYNNI